MNSDSPMDALGISWTTDREIAAWFAMRFSFIFGTRVCILGRAEPEAIILFHDERGETEIIVGLFGFGLPRLIVDHDGTDWSVLDQMAVASEGAISEWRLTADRYECRKSLLIDKIFGRGTQKP